MIKPCQGALLATRLLIILRALPEVIGPIVHHLLMNLRSIYSPYDSKRPRDLPQILTAVEGDHTSTHQYSSHPYRRKNTPLPQAPHILTPGNNASTHQFCILTSTITHPFTSDGHILTSANWQSVTSLLQRNWNVMHPNFRKTTRYCILASPKKWSSHTQTPTKTRKLQLRVIAVRVSEAKRTQDNGHGHTRGKIQDYSLQKFLRATGAELTEHLIVHNKWCLHLFIS